MSIVQFMKGRVALMAVAAVALLFNCTMAFAQNRVTGTVIDDSGEPVIGASVLEKGTTNGTVTDIDGNFSVSVAQGKTLVFSYVGYTSQEVVVKGNTLNVTLQNNDKVLDETIVVGYGSVKKSNLTSSVSKIGTNAIEDRPIQQLGDAFQGQLAGVQVQAANGGAPGEEMSIRIRGVNTITGNSSPLYVIDGTPRDNMSDLNPSDIESIQILKDASATSIYGSRGANGVVLIQTKGGKGKPTVNFNAYYGIQNAEKTLDTFNGPEWVANNWFNRNWRHIVQENGSMSDPMSARTTNNQIPDWWKTTNDFTIWQDEVLRTASLQNYEANASASSDMGSIYMSIGYQDQEGIILNTDYKRWSMRMNGTLNILDNLRVGINMTYSNVNTNGGGIGQSDFGKDSPFHKAQIFSPLIPVGMSLYDDLHEGRPSQAEWGQSAVDPKYSLENTTETHLKNRVNASFWGEWDIIKDLTFKTQYSRTFDSDQYEYFLPAWLDTSKTSKGKSWQKNYQSWVIQNTLNYSLKVGENNNLTFLLGQSAEKQDYYYANLESTGWPYATLGTLNLASTPKTASTWRSAYTNASFFGRITYDYAEKYLASFSLRRDGSSRFGANTKWGTFPSGSVGWKINKEEFLADQEWLNLLKVRASYGISGNDRIGDYQYTALLGTYNSGIGNTATPGAAASNIANQDLKWETTASLDLGLDFSAWHNRLQFNFDWYKNTTSDLLYTVSTPQTTGFSSRLTNLGEIQNTGWEIDITSHNIVKRDFKWDTSLNLSRNRNKVIDLGGDEYYESPTSMWGQYFRSYVGGPISQYWVYRTDGVLTADCFDGSGNAIVPIYTGQVEGNPRYVDTNKDGKISEDDMVAYGTNLPDLSWGITNTFSYKNWTLSVLVQGQVGGNILYVGARHNDDNYDWNCRTLLRHWLRQYKTPEMMEALNEPELAAYIKKHNIDMSWDGKTPQVFTGWCSIDDRRIYDASYVRIKNINLSYQFDKKMLKKVHMSGLKVYASVDNVAMFTDYVGYTPETSSYNSSAAVMGVDYSTYPLSRKYTLGVNVTF